MVKGARPIARVAIKEPRSSAAPPEKRPTMTKKRTAHPTVATNHKRPTIPSIYGLLMFSSMALWVSRASQEFEVVTPNRAFASLRAGIHPMISVRPPLFTTKLETSSFTK